MEAKKLTLVAAMLACTLASTVGLSTAEAHFQRNDCFNPGTAGAMGRSMGVRNGSRLFNAVYNRLGRSCAQLERISQIISETPLAAPRIRGAFQACFYQGYTDTLFGELDGAYTRCGDKCFNAGSEVGKISAQGYCAASAAVGGLDDPGFIQQPALPFCGENLVMGCKTEYVVAATVDIAGCSVYTQDNFAQIFDNTVRQDCFVPTDVPIRDGYGFEAALASSSEQAFF